MSTAAQAITNKQNAQQSTGPRTPEGKRASSLNSLRHGLTGQSVVLPGEDAEAYAAFRAKIFADTKPLGVIEEIHAQTVADTQWRLERARGLEASLIALTAKRLHRIKHTPRNFLSEFRSRSTTCKLKP